MCTATSVQDLVILNHQEHKGELESKRVDQSTPNLPVKTDTTKFTY